MNTNWPWPKAAFIMASDSVKKNNLLHVPDRALVPGSRLHPSWPGLDCRCLNPPMSILPGTRLDLGSFVPTARPRLHLGLWRFRPAESRTSPGPESTGFGRAACVLGRPSRGRCQKHIEPGQQPLRWPAHFLDRKGQPHTQIPPCRMNLAGLRTRRIQPGPHPAGG